MKLVLLYNYCVLYGERYYTVRHAADLACGNNSVLYTIWREKDYMQQIQQIELVEIAVECRHHTIGTIRAW